MERIIEMERSIIVAADVTDLESLANLAEDMKNIAGIGSFKLGFPLAMRGLFAATNAVRKSFGPGFPLIYDHQKAGNDIPSMGPKFAEILAATGIDAAILFPFTGPATQESWTKACFDAGLQVITGGVMTHPNFLASEGGYIADEAVEKIYALAAGLNVRHFVVPGNKPNWVRRIRRLLVDELGEDNFVLYAPGFITQSGDISECGQLAGKQWHAIVGSAIYEQKSSQQRIKTAKELTRQILG